MNPDGQTRPSLSPQHLQQHLLNLHQPSSAGRHSSEGLCSHLRDALLGEDTATRACFKSQAVWSKSLSLLCCAASARAVPTLLVSLGGPCSWDSPILQQPTVPAELTATRELLKIFWDIQGITKALLSCTAIPKNKGSSQQHQEEISAQAELPLCVRALDLTHVCSAPQI